MIVRLPDGISDPTSAVVPDAWPNGRIPYRMDGSLVEYAAIQYAVERWNRERAQTGVEFVPHQNERDYVEFVSRESGCFAAIGRHGGAQVVNLDGSCGHRAAVHELGHTLGLVHEHQRPDRDAYIEVFWSNLSAEASEAWSIVNYATTVTEYDLSSVMHYSEYSGSATGAPVARIRGQLGGRMGGDDISTGDIQGAARLYRVGGTDALEFTTPCS